MRSFKLKQDFLVSRDRDSKFDLSCERENKNDCVSVGPLENVETGVDFFRLIID